MKKLLVLPLLLFIIPFGNIAQTEQQKVMETVDKNNIQGPVYFLADDLLKGREAGTAENKIAASYLANMLRSYGVKPNPKTGDYYQVVPLKQVTPPRNVSILFDGKEVKNKVALESAKMNFTGQTVYLGYGTPEDFKGKDLRKKIIVIKGGESNAEDARTAFRLREEKQNRALAAGALAVIELIKADSNTWGFISRNFDGPKIDIAKTPVSKGSKAGGMAYIWVQDEYGSYAQDLKGGGTTVKIQMGGANEEAINSQNVIGYIEGTDPKLKNEFIIYSAHYDHVGVGKPNKLGDAIYNGARDNAVGVTTVLSMAENLSKYPTKRSALFILFTAEEKGLLGSKYYVDHPVFPLDQMVFCFNSDNGGYNDTSKATIVGLGRTTAEANIVSAAKVFQLTAIDDPAPEQNLFDRSDNVHFATKGIPAPTFSMGFTAFDQEIMKFYHQPEDHADSLDFDYLEKFFRAYVLSGRLIGNDSNTPFWVKGDKYEVAGKKLYKR